GLHTLRYDPEAQLLEGWSGRRNLPPRVEESGIPPEKLPDYVGKEMAQKLLEQGEITGEDISIGGTFLKKLYNEKVVNYANRYAKKFGAKVSPSEIHVPPKPGALEI